MAQSASVTPPKPTPVAPSKVEPKVAAAVVEQPKPVTVGTATVEVVPVLNPPYPSLGRIVHYVTNQETTRPAIVTAVYGDPEEEDMETVAYDLTVFNSEGAVPVKSAKWFEDEDVPGTFHFPPRV